MRKKYGFVMDSVAFYSRSTWIVRSQVRFDIQRDVLVQTSTWSTHPSVGRGGIRLLPVSGGAIR